MSTRKMKEVVRLMVNDTFFSRVPKLFVKISVEVATLNLNSFPTEGRASERFSPLSIEAGAPSIYASKCPAYFWARIETFEDNGWSYNSNRPRDGPALALGPSLRRKTGHAFMSLVTWRRLRRKKLTELPMPN